MAKHTISGPVKQGTVRRKSGPAILALNLSSNQTGLITGG